MRLRGVAASEAQEISSLRCTWLSTDTALPLIPHDVTVLAEAMFVCALSLYNNEYTRRLAYLCVTFTC
jgi:hypothetical protein